MEELLEQIREQKVHLINYMKSKIATEDWHGVADAAMDLRELEARYEVIQLLNKGKI